MAFRRARPGRGPSRWHPIGFRGSDAGFAPVVTWRLGRRQGIARLRVSVPVESRHLARARLPWRDRGGGGRVPGSPDHLLDCPVQGAGARAVRWPRAGGRSVALAGLCRSVALREGLRRRWRLRCAWLPSVEWQNGSSGLGGRDLVSVRRAPRFRARGIARSRLSTGVRAGRLSRLSPSAGLSA